MRKSHRTFAKWCEKLPILGLEHPKECCILKQHSLSQLRFSREWTFQNLVPHIKAALFGSASIQPRMDLPKLVQPKKNPTRPRGQRSGYRNSAAKIPRCMLSSTRIAKGIVPQCFERASVFPLSTRMWIFFSLDTRRLCTRVKETQYTAESRSKGT